MTLSTRRLALARRGEQAAASFYEQWGARVVARNATFREGELDLVVQEPDGTIVFVEVKTRSGYHYGGAEAVTAHKLARMRAAAARWLAEKNDGYWPWVRFDVVALQVVGEDFEIEYFEGVDDGAC